MVLIAVFGAVLIAMAIAANMTETGIDAQRLYDYTAARESNYQVARSALEMGCTLLSSDTGDTDSVNDMWASGAVTLQWDGKTVVISVVDEESKFPLSAMQNDPDNCEFLEKALVRFFENGGMGWGEEARDHFLDWVDSDSQRRTRGGEKSDYTSIPVKDAPMDSLQELLLLPGWTDPPSYTSPRKTRSLETVAAAELNKSSLNSGTENTGTFGNSSGGSEADSTPSYELSAPEAQTLGGRETGQWKDWVSLYSSGKININTAPIEVIMCLDDSMTRTLAQEIDSKRRSSAFKNVNELLNVTGMDSDLEFRIADYLCVKSKIFTIDASVLSYPGRVSVHAVVERSDSSVKILRWEVE